MNVVYGCCVGSWDRFQRYVWPHVEGRHVVATSGHGSIAVAYNAILNAVARWEDLDALILLHDDLELIDPDAEDKFITALAETDVELVGVAGARDVKSLAWWEGDPIGHQTIENQVIDFGQRTGDVNALEGSVIALSSWAVTYLRFDERYPGFHGYDCDIAMTAQRLSARAVVADIDTYHHTHIGFKTDTSARDWGRANDLFRQKWHL